MYVIYWLESQLDVRYGCELLEDRVVDSHVGDVGQEFRLA